MLRVGSVNAEASWCGGETECGREERGREECGREECGREEHGREECGREECGREERGREERGREEHGREERGREERGREERGREERGREECGREERGREERGREEHCARLHRTLKRIVKARAALDREEAEALREAERLRIWRHLGYSSLVEYMEMELGYSPRAALERLRVANAIVELPTIAEALAQGELSFSAVRELTRVVTPETEQVWLDASDGKNLRDIEQLVSGHKRGDTPDDPVDPKLRKRVLRFDELDEETIAIVRQARQIVDREVGERLDNNRFLRALARLAIDGAASGAGPSARSRAPYQIAVMDCERCKRSWQDGGGVTVEMSPAKREVAECDAQHIGSVDSEPAEDVSDDTREGASENATMGAADRALPPTCTQAARGQVQPATKARTAIPAPLRRKVIARDHGRCRVPWCRSIRNIDQHHIRPICEGGEHSLSNVISLCESHHIALHEGALVLEGDASNARFTRRAQSSFEDTRNAVETAEALRTLGFRKNEVTLAIEKTRTHVGSAQLGLEQWIKIALSYCPRPSG